jgi:SAM-dependent methyltransferase
MNYEFPRIINDPTFTPNEVGHVLDIGCATGILGALLRTYRTPASVTGIEVYAPYFNRCQEGGNYDNLYLHDLEHGELPFENDKFDLAYGLHIVEHLPESSAIALLEEAKRVAKRVVIVTPSTFNLRTPVDGNQHQVHQCLIGARDLKRLGYTVRGIGALHHLPIQSWVLGSLIPSAHATLVATWEKVKL